MSTISIALTGIFGLIGLMLLLGNMPNTLIQNGSLLTNSAIVLAFIVAFGSIITRLVR